MFMLAEMLGLTRRRLPLPGPSGQQDDYVAAVTALFRDVAVAVEENEAFLRDNFGTASVIEVVMGLQVGLSLSDNRLCAAAYVRQFCCCTTWYCWFPGRMQ